MPVSVSTALRGEGGISIRAQVACFAARTFIPPLISVMAPIIVSPKPIQLKSGMPVAIAAHRRRIPRGSAIAPPINMFFADSPAAFLNSAVAYFASSAEDRLVDVLGRAAGQLAVEADGVAHGFPL